MLSKSNDTTIHVKNIQKIMIAFYKYFYGPSVPIMKERKLLQKNSLCMTFDLRSCRVTLLPNLKTKKPGTDKVAY